MTKPTTLSFEIFPPNTQVGEEKLIHTLSQLKDLQPDFISVTCSNNKRRIEETTLKVADYIKQNLSVPTIAHLPAAYLDKQQVQDILNQLRALGITDLLALRGDIIPEVEPKQDFHYASDLIRFIKEEAPDFTITGACYPEIHPEACDRVTDIKNLKTKVDAGCQQLVTQLFFDNEVFFQFQENCSLAGIDVPLIAGVMPITNRKQVLRILQNNQVSLPRKFRAILEKYEHNPEALRAAGLAYAVDQIVDLTTQGADGIHLYTMNNAETAKHIYRNTEALFATEKALVE